MGFAAPWLLAAAAAVGLPIWLHMLRRNRSTPRPFSSVMFWEPRTETSVRRRRMQYYLLFALRTALLVLIALAFARPYFETRGVASGSRNLVVAIDTSASMREGGRLERAKRMAAEELRKSATARIISLGRTATVHPASDLPAIRATADKGSLAELPSAVRAFGDREALEVHLYSDFQNTALPAAFADLAMPPNAKLVVHPIVESATPNWAVESAAAPARIYGADSARVQATVRGFATNNATRRVSVYLNGQAAGTREVAIAANGRATVDFDLRSLPHGLNRGEVRIEPGDTLAADDRYHFSIERAEPRPVLYVGDRRGALYFGAALEAVPGSPFRVVQGSSQGEYAFVVVSGASAPAWLEDYVRKGGSVLFGAVAGASPLTGKLQPVYYGRDDDRFQSVTWMDTSHPVLKDANLWSGVRFYQVARGTDLKPLARLADGTPVLGETRVGEGLVLVFGSTFDNLANDFPLHNSFVPFVARAAAYLSRVEGFTAQHVAGAAIELTPGLPLEILDPRGQRALSLTEARTARAIELTEEGFYELRRGGGRSELLAVNADRRESDLALAPRETLDLWMKSTADPRGAAPGAAPVKRVDLWPYLLGAAILVTLAESFVGSRHLAGRAEPLRKGAAA